MTARAWVKGVVHRLGQHPVAESILRGVVSRLHVWPGLQYGMTRIVPQPSDYGIEASRETSRGDFRWKLDPHHYFQWHHYFGFHDQVLVTLLDLANPGAMVIDVGANVGLYSTQLARHVGRMGQVWAFEPNHDAASRIEEHKTLNRVENLEIHRVALGKTSERAWLSGVGTRDLGKFSLRSSVPPHRTANEGDDPETDGAWVDVYRLDDILAEHGVERVDLVKIDVEGFEPETLSGARETFGRDWPHLVIEASPAWYGEKMDLFLAEMEFLASGPYQWSTIGLSQATPLDIQDWMRQLDENTPQCNLVARRKN